MLGYLWSDPLGKTRKIVKTSWFSKQLVLVQGESKRITARPRYYSISIFWEDLVTDVGPILDPQGQQNIAKPNNSWSIL